MKLNFKFTNLFGTVYKSGNLEFIQNGSCLLSPVGNQVTVYHLLRDEARTISVNSQFNLTHVTISPVLPVLFAVNTNGEGYLVSLISGNVVNTYNFRHPISAVAFSPNGKYLAISKNHCIMVFLAPEPKRSANSLELYRFLYGFGDTITNIDWSSDSRFIIAGCQDKTARILSVRKCEKLIIYTLSGHNGPVYGRFCKDDSLDCFTLSTDGELRIWTCDTKLKDMDVKTEDKMTNDDERIKTTFKLIRKHFYRNFQNQRIHEEISSLDYHRKLQMLVTGFSNGNVMLHQLPEFNIIDRSRLIVDPLSSVVISPAGDWIAMASEGGNGGGGELAVWEWRTHSAHLRASSHGANEVNALAYSPDGRLIATGGRDAKVRLWRVASGGRAVVTFTEHAAPVSAVAFPSAKPKVLLSASLDGTIRAFDLNRYRNFRTMSVPTNSGAQFSCLGVDSAGELVAAGASDSFDCYVFALRTGDLLCVLSGHGAPVSSVQFSPHLEIFGRLELMTGSWDSTVRTWALADCEAAASKGGEGGGATLLETLDVSTDVVCAAYRHDGREIAVALLNATILFFDASDGTQLGSIEGRCDLDVAQVSNDDHVTPHRAAKERKFLSIAYSADGQHLLAAGDSKYICLYSVPDRLLLKRFELTVNLSLEGVQEAFDRRRYLAAFGEEAAAAKADQRDVLPLPGVRSGDGHSRRWWRPDVRVASVSFAPTGDAFAVAATEGVFVYTLEKAGLGYNLLGGVSNWLFDAIAVDEDTTPSNARLQLSQGNLSAALDIALRLQMHDLIEEIIEAVPHALINFTVRNMPLSLVLRSLVPFLARQIEGGRSRHLAFYVAWVDSVFMVHASSLRNCLAQTSRPRNPSSQLRLLGMEDANEEQVRECLQKPGVLLEHGEFRAFQASLIRLQTALEGVKASLINRMDGLDATWKYLSQIGRLSRGRKEFPLPSKVSSDETETEEEDQPPPSEVRMIVDLDEQEEIIQKAKNAKKRKNKKSGTDFTSATSVPKKQKLESPAIVKSKKIRAPNENRTNDSIIVAN